LILEQLETIAVVDKEKSVKSGQENKGKVCTRRRNVFGIVETNFKGAVLANINLLQIHFIEVANLNIADDFIIKFILLVSYYVC